MIRTVVLHLNQRSHATVAFKDIDLIKRPAMQRTTLTSFFRSSWAHHFDRVAHIAVTRGRPLLPRLKNTEGIWWEGQFCSGGYLGLTAQRVDHSLAYLAIASPFINCRNRRLHAACAQLRACCDFMRACKCACCVCMPLNLQQLFVRNISIMVFIGSPHELLHLSDAFFHPSPNV